MTDEELENLEEEWGDKTRKILAVGTRLFLDYGKDNPYSEELEIRGKVDNRIVYRNSEGRYDLQRESQFQLWYANGRIRPL